MDSCAIEGACQHPKSLGIGLHKSFRKLPVGIGADGNIEQETERIFTCRVERTSNGFPPHKLPDSSRVAGGQHRPGEVGYSLFKQGYLVDCQRPALHLSRR